MVKELYQYITREVCLNVNVGRVDSVRKKDITKSGCRVYEGGYIGVAGCLGQPTEETWNEAIRALERKLPSPGPETGKVRHCDLTEETMTAEEFLQKTQELLAILTEEFPDYVLSNKVIMVEVEERLSNDAGLDYVAINRGYDLSVVVKQIGSPNVFDTFLGHQGRKFEFEQCLADARQILTAHRTLLEMPEGKEQLFITDNSGGNALAGFGILRKALNGQKYYVGASQFQGKLGEKLFSERASIVGDRSGELSGFATFFDDEGVVRENDRVAFIENGVFKNLMTDKKYAALLGTESTGCAFAPYDGAPSLSSCEIRVAPTGQTAAELTAGQDSILIGSASGGDWTDDGNFATPVQCAYVYRDGKLIGRLPEFTMTVKLDELFGDRFVGCSTDKLFDDNILVFRGTIL